jgi:hypothetical protein
VSYTGNGPNPVVFNFTLQTGGASTTFSHFAYGGAPVAIPLGNAAGVDVPFDVSGFTGTIAKVRLNIDGATCSAVAGATTVGIDHSWAGDLILSLRAPSGRSVTVISEAGGPFNSGNNFCQTILDDDAVNSISSVNLNQAPFTGTFKPFQPLSGFAGEAANGTWNLHAQDLVAADTGSVRAFSIDVAPFTCD